MRNRKCGSWWRSGSFTGSMVRGQRFHQQPWLSLWGVCAGQRSAWPWWVVNEDLFGMVLMTLRASATAMPAVDWKALCLFFTEKPVSTSKKRACWCWLGSASSMQTPVRSVGCAPCRSCVVNLFQVLAFRIFMRWRGNVLGQGEDDIIILTGADSSVWERAWPQGEHIIVF